MLQAQPVLRAARNWACMTWKWEPHLWSCMRHSNFELPIALVFICIWHHKTHTQELAARDPNVLNWYELTPLFNLLPTRFVSPSFIGIRSFQDSGISRYITVYHGYRRYLTTELSKIELRSYLSFASVDFAINRCGKHDPQGRACKPHSASSGPLLDAMDIWCFSICSNSSSISNMQFVVWYTWRNRNWSSWLYNP